MFHSKEIFNRLLFVALSLSFCWPLSASAPSAFGGAGGGPSCVARPSAIRLSPQSVTDFFDTAGEDDDGFATSPALATPVASSEVFTEAQVATLHSLADSIFKSKQEAIFSSASGDVNKYMENNLSDEFAFKGAVILLKCLWKEFDTYIRQARLDHDNCNKWLDNRTTQFFASGTHDYDKRTEAFVEKKIIRQNRAPAQTVFFMGDIHGSVHALLRNLLLMQQMGYLNDDFSFADNVHMVFLGDLTDRGLQGVETVYTVLRLKNKNWGNVHMVRGNHENKSMVQKYGFEQEVKEKYGIFFSEYMIRYADFCTTLPSALFLGFYDEGAEKMRFMQCSHGGIAPHHDPRSLLCSAEKQYEAISYREPQVGYHYEWNDVSCVSATQRLLAGSDLEGLSGIEWTHNPKRGSHSYIMHRDDITKLLHRNNLFMLMRGHQDQGAPCKVLQEGEDTPVSWRVHEKFTGIQPTDFFKQGITLVDAPNCFTMTNATEARQLVSECVFALTIGGNFNNARIWMLEADLYKNHVMDEWGTRKKAMHSEDPDTRKESEALFASDLRMLVSVTRHQKYVRYNGYSRELLNARVASAACAALQCAASDGTIPTCVEWGEKKAEAGLFLEHAYRFPVGTKYMPAARPLEWGGFGKGSVRESLGS